MIGDVDVLKDDFIKIMRFFVPSADKLSIREFLSGFEGFRSYNDEPIIFRTIRR